MIELTLSALATFGAAALISDYDGVFDIFLRLRKKSKAFGCIVCLSFWIAIPMLYLTSIGIMAVVYLFAIVGLVIITERLT